jgi:hypothetical protein
MNDQITPNQLNYTLDELQVCYETAHLVLLFQELLEDEYTGLGLGLIIDLIKQRLDPLHKPDNKKETKSYAGYLTIPFDVENISPDQDINEIINGALDKLGEIDLGSFTWDNPDWAVYEIDND